MHLFLAQIEAVPAFVAITVAALGVVFTWLAIVIWGWRSGQLDDAEAAKHRVFEDDVPSGPGRRARTDGTHGEGTHG